MNTYGQIFRLTSFGESHGPMIGGVIDGCPAGLNVDIPAIQSMLDLRRPGTSPLTSPRDEADQVQFVSGIYQGKSTGTPIAFIIQNKDARPGDYEAMHKMYRPGHADYTYEAKYGIRDPRGGGRSSARETACRTVAGALARQLLGHLNIHILAYISALGATHLQLGKTFIHTEGISDQISQSIVRCPDPVAAQAMIEELKDAQKNGDSLGGIVCCEATGIPAGWGEPIYHKLSARLADAMMSINAARGFDLGDGFALANYHGSEANDSLIPRADGRSVFATNHSGGILGGISTGQDIRLRVAFKPTPTISRTQQTIDSDGQTAVLSATGRHDPCVAIRAVTVVESMCAMVLADAYLMARSSAPL